MRSSTNCSLRAIVCTTALLILSAKAGHAQDVVPDTVARRYVGREITVEGTVARVKPSHHRQNTFLNFGQDYPNQTFSVWVPDSANARFHGDTALAAFTGKRVRVTGTVWLQDNKWPAMTIVDPSRLVLAPRP